MPNHKETAVKTAVAERILYEGWSVRQAAKQIDVSKSTVQDWVNRYRKTLSLERRPGSGRKRITTSERDAAVAKNTSQTSCNLKKAVNSPRCVQKTSNHLQNVSIVCLESQPHRPGTQEASPDEKIVYRDREKEMCENEEIKVENSNIVYLPIKEEYDITQQAIPEVKQEHEEMGENEEIKAETLYENDEYENPHQEFPVMEQDIELLIGNVKVELKEENVCENIRNYDNDDHTQFPRKSTTNSLECYKSSIHKSHPIFIEERNIECSSASDKTSNDSLANGTLNSENILNSDIHTKIKIEDSTFTNSDESSLERQFCTQNIYSDTEDCKFSITGNGSISQADLNQEILKHQCKLFPCNECGKSFSRRENLNHHMNVYSEDHPFSCKECGKSFPKKRNLQRHKLIHKNIRTQTCNICLKSFAYASALKNHMNIHSKVRFTCDTCGKSFSHKCTLENHMLLHGNKLPFQCDICGKSFVTHNLVSRHKRIHTGNFPFSCTLCGKAFNQKCHLKVHLAVHTGDQPFSCELCGKSFSRKFNLVRHMSLHNSESSNQL